MFEKQFPKERLDFFPCDIDFIRNIINDTWFLDRAHVTDDYDKSIELLAKHIDFEVEEYPSGANYGMWTIPPKWTVHKGVLKTMDGKIIADYHRHPLELWSYSDSFQGKIKRKDLLPHCWSNPNRPDDVTYHPRLQYRHWEKDWGFCIPHNVLQSLKDDFYQVDIQTEFSKSTMKTIDHSVPGSTDKMIILSGHWDHTAQCNDGLVGCVVALDVLRRLKKHKNLRYNYHALLTVEFIGSVAWLECNRHRVENISEGLFVAMMGSAKPFALQRSFQSDSTIERLLHHFLEWSGQEFREGPVNTIVNNDEKAYDSPGIKIPMASLSRSLFAEYHTDKDDPDHLHDDRMIEGSDLIYQTLLALENNYYPVAKFRGLPCLSKPEINLYLSPRSLSQLDTSEESLRDGRRFGHLPDDLPVNLNYFMTTVVNYMEGKHSVLDIAEIFKLPYFFVWNYLKAWEDKGLIAANLGPVTD